MSEIKDIALVVTQAQPGFLRIADRHQLVTWAEESQFALQAVKRNPALLECAPETVQDAIINIAAVGLTLNPSHQYAFLVPEYNTQTKRKECQLRISYRGLIKIATDSDSIRWVRADVVHKNDTFTYRGPHQMPDLAMDPFGERGDPVGVYCIAKTHEGDILVETAPWSEVMKAKDAAKTKYVWDQWESEMARKFIIKRASKQWPRTDRHERLSTAVDVLNRQEGSEHEIDHYDHIALVIKEGLEANDEAKVFETIDELSDYDRKVLSSPLSKGGWFDTDDKRRIREIMEKQNGKTIEEPIQTERKRPTSVAAMVIEAEGLTMEESRMFDLLTSIKEALHEKGDAVLTIWDQLSSDEKILVSARLDSTARSTIKRFEAAREAA